MPASNEHQEAITEQESYYLWRKKLDSPKSLIHIYQFHGRNGKNAKKNFMYQLTVICL